MTSITNRIITVIICLGSTCCVTVPPIDRITSFDSRLPKEPTVVKPCTPIVYVEQINRPQTLLSKINYINTCLINYSWGRGWTDKATFSN
jgi:hypothetical protein